MSKTERHRQELEPLFRSLLGEGSSDALTRYLVAQSNLPGRRANLELAQAFGDAVAAWTREQSQEMWALCTQLIGVSSEEAPVNDPREFLPFCGAVGLGSVGATKPDCHQLAIDALHRMANDPRWRLREAVCFGLQRLLAAAPEPTLAALQSWLPDGSWLELRAVAAAVAHPELLQDRDLARLALNLHRRILARLESADPRERKSDPFKVLRKGLGYTPSVLVQALPGEGLVWLGQLAESSDREIRWIVRQNLKKTRLVRGFPEQVDRLQRRLTSDT